MAGRTAKPVLPLGAFYPRNCAIFGFAMFNATPDQQRRCADDIIRWIEEGQLKPIVGRDLPPGEPPPRPNASSKKTPSRARVR